VPARESLLLMVCAVFALAQMASCPCSKFNLARLRAGTSSVPPRRSLRSSTLVTIMQTADLREGNNVAGGGKLYGARTWAILVEREMRSGVMMILKIAR
jgi:hypothetical protein